MDHLKYANANFETQRDALFEIVHASPTLTQALHAARDTNLPDWWIVSGAIYNQVWNHLTNRPDMYGVNDIDLMYFDPDTSYDAEDRIIKSAKGFPQSPPIEIRNQARVHLWYEKHFGIACEPITHTKEAIDRFASRTHCVGLQLQSNDTLDCYAPFGLNDIFSFRVTPNPNQNNKETHDLKSARQKSAWPELTIVPWPNS